MARGSLSVADVGAGKSALPLVAADGAWMGDALLELDGGRCVSRAVWRCGAVGVELGIPSMALELAGLVHLAAGRRGVRAGARLPVGGDTTSKRGRLRGFGKVLVLVAPQMMPTSPSSLVRLDLTGAIRPTGQRTSMMDERKRSMGIYCNSRAFHPSLHAQPGHRAIAKSHAHTLPPLEPAQVDAGRLGCAVGQLHRHRDAAGCRA